MSKRRYTGVEETRQQLPSLLDAAHAGDPVIITKHGKPYAAIVPLDSLRRTGRARPWWHCVGRAQACGETVPRLGRAHA